MKDRQKKMLRFMLINKGIVLIDDLAEAFSVGRRTVSRDLDSLDKWLSLRGARLERKPNQGIQVLTFGSDPTELLELINQPEAYIESLPAPFRQKLILLYLLFNNREIKISDIANTFFISDTSVWNDLNAIDQEIEKDDFYLERQKGVGISLKGSEKAIRLKFLSIVTETFSSRTIIPYLYSFREDSASSLEINQFKLLMERLKFPVSSDAINRNIEKICGELGYQFTMSGEALLHFYLQLTIHRIKSGAMMDRRDKVDCLPMFRSIGEEVLDEMTSRIVSGALPDSEFALMGLIIQILEIGDISVRSSQSTGELITDDVRDLTLEMINAFGKEDNRLYYLNEHMEMILNLALSSLINRLHYKIPYWHGEWGDSSQEDWGREEKEKILSKLLLNRFGLQADSRDLEYILLNFYSLIFSKKEVPERKVRCMVCCFEGIGLASYLQSVLQRDIEELHIVEATAVFKIRQEYLDEKGIELILSTFPISDVKTPVISLSLPLNKEELKVEISRKIEVIRGTRSKVQEPVISSSEEGREGFSFDGVLSFIHSFGWHQFPDGKDNGDIINRLSDELTESSNRSKDLAISFQKREDIGPLYFDEYGIKVLHCKSSSVDIPHAGVISFNDDEQSRIIYMVAPDPCPDSIRKMLSVITISFLENRPFRESVMEGSLNQIRRNLMDIYKELI